MVVLSSDSTPVKVDHDELDEMYDDACDVGKFFLNPCLFLVMFVRARCRSCWKRRNLVMSSRIARFAQNSVVPNIIKVDQFLTKHAMQIVYLAAVFGSWAVIFLQLYPLVEENDLVESYHKDVGYAVFFLSVCTWRYACGISPGNITMETMWKFDNYLYDNIIYESKLCPSLKIQKLARSKYDRYTKSHVPRFDHHCVWIGQSVGEENYRWFLIFLTVHALMCWYGSIMTFLILWGEVYKEVISKSYIERTGAMMFVNFYLTVVLMFMFAMSAVLGSFLGFHLYIISKGMTTNEYYKWKRVRKWHKEALQKYQQVVDNELSPNASGAITAASSSQPYPLCTDVGTSAVRNRGTDEEINNKEFLTNPGPLMPRNIYDLGFCANFSEVAYPRSLQIRQRQKNM